MLLFTGCSVKGHKDDDAIKIAREDFGKDELLVVSGAVLGHIISDEIKRYGIYVLGEKDNEEMMIVVPCLKNQKPFEIDWGLNKSFSEIIERLNNCIEGEKCTKENYRLIDFTDTLDIIHQLLPDTKTLQLDVEFMITYLKYDIVQIDGEIVIYNDDKRIEIKNL